MEQLLHDLILSPAWYYTAARGLTLILIVGALYVAAAFVNRYLTRHRT